MRQNNGEGEIVAYGMTGELTQEQNKEAGKLVLRFLDPEDLGHSVTGEVRDLVRLILGRPAVESWLKKID